MDSLLTPLLRVGHAQALLVVNMRLLVDIAMEEYKQVTYDRYNAQRPLLRSYMGIAAIMSQPSAQRSPPGSGAGTCRLTPLQAGRK